MTSKNLDKAPFPWFGGKSKAAPTVWALLGDVPHYVEPFYGSGAVLLNRPHHANRPYVSETVNDLDGFVVNAWRAMQWAPDAMASAASWPVAEADKQARQIALLRWRDAGAGERLAGDAAWYDPVMAGWWAWAVCCQIGAFAGDGPWIADPATGRIVKQGRGAAREPGVTRDLPHISSNGMGVNNPGVREPGVLDPITAEHGRSALDGWGAEYHDRAMPELIRWFRHLSARLRHVRILNGDWKRAVTSGAALTLPVRSGKGSVGVFLDPPYADTANRAKGLYAVDSFDVAHDVRAWALTRGDDPQWRIVLAGFDGEHGTDLVDAGWREIEWYQQGHMTGGYGDQQHKERLWASPHCLGLEADTDPTEQLDMLRST
jgi:DNA adenine methylase